MIDEWKIIPLRKIRHPVAVSEGWACRQCLQQEVADADMLCKSCTELSGDAYWQEGIASERSPA